MIDIELIGQIRNKKLVHKMCADILTELLPRIRRDIEISIHIVRECDSQEGGYCLGSKDGAVIDVARTTNGQGVSYEDILLTICHELVHAKQFIKGELTQDSRWMGEPMRHLAVKDHPWEHEAYKLEKILYNKYTKGVL